MFHGQEIEFCKVREHRVEYVSVTQHLETEKHVQMIKLGNRSRQGPNKGLHKLIQLKSRLLLSANIPLNELSNRVFRHFLDFFFSKLCKNKS